MAAYSNVSEALIALEEKLKTLQSVTEANQFLVEAMRDHKDELSEMSEGETRTAMLDWAHAEFGEGAEREDEAVLEILQTSFAPRKSAEIIPFPQRK
jgi:hypothetical protein